MKDSNLRSFRDGFTVPRLQACDQRKHLTHNNFRAYSPQTADVSRGQPDATRALLGPPSWVDTSNQELRRRYAERPDSEDLLGPVFIIRELRDIHEAIAGTIRDPASRLVEADVRVRPASHPQPRLVQSLLCEGGRGHGAANRQ